jgi:hypothetical protein
MRCVLAQRSCVLWQIHNEVFADVHCTLKKIRNRDSPFIPAFLFLRLLADSSGIAGSSRSRFIIITDLMIEIFTSAIVVVEGCELVVKVESGRVRTVFKIENVV